MDDDLAIIIDRKIFSDSKVLLTVLTKTYGIQKLSVRVNKNQKFGYQIGNLIEYSSKFNNCKISYGKCEISKPYMNLVITDRLKMFSIMSLTEMIDVAFKANTNYGALFNSMNQYLSNLVSSIEIKMLEYFVMEIQILKNAGYGLSLQECGVTGCRDNLIYISPKTGRSISESIGYKYRNKLLSLPQFLLKQTEPKSKLEIIQAIKSIGYFIQRYIHHNLYSRNRFTDLCLDLYNLS